MLFKEPKEEEKVEQTKLDPIIITEKRKNFKLEFKITCLGETGFNLVIIDETEVIMINPQVSYSELCNKILHELAKIRKKLE